MSIKLMSEVWELPLNTNEKMVLLAICDHANDEGIAYPSWERIKAKCSISSKSTLSKIMSILEATGLIKITKRGDLKEGRKTNIYKVDLSKSTLLELKENLAIERDKHKRSISTQGVPSKSTLLEPEAVHSSNSNHHLTTRNSFNHQYITPEIEVISGEVIDDFDVFWKAWPKKKDKANAEKAFIKALKTTTLDVMLVAIENHKKTNDWQKDNGKFIPYPATWLNGKRWEDEFTIADISQSDYVSAVLKASNA